MSKFVAVDPGKGDTKVNVFEYKGEKGKESTVKTYIYSTKYCEGDFCDDALENKTFLVELDGKTYKVGNGAIDSAELDVTKKSEIHRISTLMALAMVATPGKVDEMNVVIGCPLSEYSVPRQRKEYMDYMLPDDVVTVKIKTKSDAEPEERKFKIVSKKVLPETAGIFFLNLEKYDGDTLGIIDIGNGTAIGAIYSDFEIDHEFDFTDRRGGAILINSLSAELSTKYAHYNRKYTLKLLLKPAAERFLSDGTGDKKKEEESKTLIHNSIVKYLKEIRESCKAKGWSLDYMPIVFAGGTSLMLKEEIKEVFGPKVTFIDAKYGTQANSLGFLRRLVQMKLGIDVMEYTSSAEKEERKAGAA